MRVEWHTVGGICRRVYEQLENKRASIRCVSADAARWIADCVKKYCPHTERSLDPFHVVSWAIGALDQVHREAWHEAYQKTKSAPKRGKGCPARGKNTNQEKQKARSIKNCRYALLKNPENLTDGHKAQLAFLTKANPKLYRVYLPKEALRLALKAGPDEIAAALTKWMP